MNLFEKYTKILIEGGEISEILSLIRQESDVDVAWKEYQTGRAFSTGSGVFSEHAAVYPLNELTRLYCSTEIRLQRNLMGYLIYDMAHTEPMAEPKNGIAALRLFCSRKMERDKLNSHYRNEFVRDIIYGKIRHEDELKNRAASFLWNLDGGVVCVIVSGGESFDSRDLVRSRIKSLFPSSIFAELSGSTVFLLSQTLAPRDMKSFVAGLSELLSALCRDIRHRDGIGILAAVGGYRENLILAEESYQEARQTLMILESRSSENAFAFWEQLGGARLIATLSGMSVAKEFCRHVLSPLLDKNHKNDELIRTLICLDENRGNLRSASEKLSLHYNSLKYRAARIWELLNIDPEDYEERFELSLALQIYKFLKGNL